MPDVTSTPRGTDRFRLAAALACFAVAGVANATVDGLGLTLTATTVAVVGVYALARHAGSVSRRALARTALALWLAFLTTAVGHAAGLETLGTVAPGPAAATVLAVTAVTWATLLAAAGTTLFLGLREYGSPAPADDAVLEGETSDYSSP
ncbi:hypothetical protein NP511_03765 [Natrinema thermotolerans]|uniref:Uncharacterized protein n=1 Tax=Natrinema thermotolerans TaxID=121872 RepID=A0AAF0PFW4_9EURY|nr:hypothetical protein [Natrinema thermotolerans]WMT08754.1 hypothetical protein NP511_03765 [Natrinema thermotolerans]